MIDIYSYRMINIIIMYVVCDVVMAYFAYFIDVIDLGYVTFA